MAAAQQREACTRLRAMPCFGAQTTTALVEASGDGRAFEGGPDLAVRLGLTPRENSTAGKQRLCGRISKRGNRSGRAS